MITFDGTAFARTRNGFVRYISKVRNMYRVRERHYKTQKPLYQYSLEETMEIEKIIALDKAFMELTTAEEKIAIKYMGYHNPDEKEPENLWHFINTAYEKWYSVFFHEDDPLFGKIDPVLMGKQIEYLRTTQFHSKSMLSSMMRIDRTTLIDIEQGIRLPSLELLHKISVFYRISMDKLIKQSLKQNIFEITHGK